MIDYHALSNLFRVGQKLAEPDRDRCTRQIPISSFVEAIDEITGLLELYREEVGGTDIDSLDLNAPHIAAASNNLVSPEGQTFGVGLAV